MVVKYARTKQFDKLADWLEQRYRAAEEEDEIESEEPQRSPQKSAVAAVVPEDREPATSRSEVAQPTRQKPAVAEVVPQERESAVAVSGSEATGNDDDDSIE
jgi:hypothetical protein